MQNQYLFSAISTIPMKFVDLTANRYALHELSVSELSLPLPYLALQVVEYSDLALARNIGTVQTQNNPNRLRDGPQVFIYCLFGNHRDSLKVPQTFRLDSTDN